MSRTTPDLVKGILLRNYDRKNSPDLTPFIDIASSIVDDIVTNDLKNVMTDAKLELVERLLAAHEYYAADQGYSSKSEGKASATFQGKTGMGFDSDEYGKRAKMLDASGYLRALDSKGVDVGVDWVGSDDD